jgi:bacillithiol biosynthesis deacetylase BshB1
MNVDILAIGVHPDDVELGCGGIIAKHTAKGYKVGIIDLTLGELGTRGTVEIRKKEAENGAKILGASFRENLEFRDGFFKNDEEHQLKLIAAIRKYKPKFILTNAPHDRHPDHGKAAQLTVDAAFLSGLTKIVTQENGVSQNVWRPSVVYHYIQAYYHQPDLVVNITDSMDIKMRAVKAYSSQFHNPESNEPETLISSPEFLEFTYARALEFGLHAGFRYGEGLLTNRYIGVEDLTLLK